MNDILIRRASEDELGALAQLYAEAFPKEAKSVLGSAACKEYLRAIHKHPAYALLVAVSGDKPLGFSVIHLDPTVALSRGWACRALGRFLLSVPRDPLRVARVVEAFVARARSARARLGAASSASQRRPVQSPGERVLCNWDYMAVAKESRGLGIGRKLLEATIDVARGHGCSVVRLLVHEANQVAIALYERCGFIRVGALTAENKFVYEKPVAKP